MFDRMISEACVELFRAFHLSIRPSSSLSADAPESDATTRTAAVVTFAGPDARGTLVLATSFEVVAACVPAERGRALSPRSPADWAAVRDCTKELVNQLLGRIKNRLRAEGMIFEARTPTVVTGHAVASMLASRSGAPFRFTAGDRSLSVWFDVVVVSESKRPISERTPGAALREGDVALSPASDRSPASSGGPKRVLVIDDSLIVRQQVGATLRQAGYEVVEAASGVEGLRVVESGERLGMILCDVNMPLLGGLALLELLVERGLSSRCPFVMLTSEAQPEAVARARAAGARGWMVKPVKPEALVGAVRKLVG